MAPPLLALRDIRLTFGGTPVFEGAELAVVPGDRLCLVGRNGSGKSTLLRIAAGQIEADSGERFVQPGATIRYLPQEPDLSGFATALDVVRAGLGPADDAYRAQYLLEQLGLSGSEDPARLSGGEVRRCALAQALAPMPDIVLLDEPTNHLDLPAIEWLESELASLSSAIVLISHDRRFLANLSRRTLWIADGRTRLLDSGFADFEAWRDTILEQEEVERHKLDRKLVAETAWLRQGVPARRKRNQGRLRALFALRDQRRSQRQRLGAIDAAVTEADASGKLVIEAKRISKSFGGAPVVRDFSLRIQRGDRIGIVGPNGAGKTTLVNLLTGALAPDGGSLRLGANLAMVTLDQKREGLDANRTLAETLADGSGDMVSVGESWRHVVGYMKDFLFAPEQARTPVSRLSGGERGRLMLARALARPSNLLVLDEPTNDLDLETLDLLQEMLADYAGTVLLVSHDRDFLDRVVTSTLAWHGPGEWIEYAGGYSDMMLQRGSDLDRRRAAKAPRARQDEKSGDKPTERRPPAPRKQLSFKDKHALQTLPARIERLQDSIRAGQAKLADPQLYARDPAGFGKIADELKRAEADLAAAEDQWLQLEMLREEIEGAA
ncbi:MAG: ABC-F family ATP-binding cassette domain-containing protein [Reyranellaceae bacterium]